MFLKKAKPIITFTLATQTTLISLCGFIISFSIIFFNIYIQYLEEEEIYANNKLLKYWTLLSHMSNDIELDNFVLIAMVRNEYKKDLSVTDDEYALRIEDPYENQMLFFYPIAWQNKDIVLADFNTTFSTNTGTKLEVMEDGRRRKINFMLYEIQHDSYHIQVLLSSEERIRFFVRITRSSIGILFVVAVVGYIISQVIVRRSLRPLHRINKLAEKIIVQQKIDQRIPVDARGEFIRLQHNINSMLDVIERQVNSLRSATISLGHDIRTPLTHILNYLEVAKDSCTNKQENEKLSACIKSIHNIQKIARQVLDLSEIESGIVKIPINKINVKEVLEGIVDMYSIIAEEKEIQFNCTIDAECYLLAEEVRLRQLIGNLLENAIKFTDAGGSVSLLILQKADKVSIEVSDTGIGIDVKDIPYIWKLTWKKHHKNNNLEGGGFGLSIVNSIVNVYKGEISVVSEVGKGTMFTVLFSVTKL